MQRKACAMSLAGGSLAAIAVGWLAARIHASGHAPIVLTPLAVGALLGAILSALAASQRLASRRVLIFVALILSILAIAAEHAWLYLDFRGQWRDARTKTPAVAIFRPESPPSPSEYFAREWNPKLWFSDAAIFAAATIAVVLVARQYFRKSNPQHPRPDT
jgi:hypothetical protein